jgi:hypothetical protein
MEFTTNEAFCGGLTNWIEIRRGFCEDLRPNEYRNRKLRGDATVRQTMLRNNITN